MLTVTKQTQVNIGGLSFSGQMTRQAEGVVAESVALDAAVAGSLTTRSDDDSGTVTTPVEHGLNSADTVNVFWEGGCRYGMDINSIGVGGDTVTLEGGAGDVLPAQDTSVFIAKQVSVAVSVDGDLAVYMVALASTRGHIAFHTASACLHAVSLPASEAWEWASEHGIANPLTGDPIVEILASAGSGSAASLQLGILYDSVT